MPLDLPLVHSNPVKLTHLKDGRKAIIIRTSDRIAFKQCRRKWAWSSHLKDNWGSLNLASALWFGSAVHYGLEDFHGLNSFGNPADAFRAYCIATSKQHIRELPSDAKDLFELGTALLDYYANTWLVQPGRPPVHPTYMYAPGGGEPTPQVEVNFEIPIPLDEFPRLAALAKQVGADCILYRGTIDRVGVDPETGDLWIYEYKTAKRAEHLHYETDPQVTVYAWAASHIYDRPVAGIVYLQFVKTLPKVPMPLSSGKISTAANGLVTSVPLYRRGLENMYGSVERAPIANQDYLTELMTKEDENKDRFIQRALITRNQFQMDMEAQKIILEVEDMINPDLSLYPNPTRDCSRMCGFLTPCVQFDCGADWEGSIRQKFGPRDQDPDTYWRRRLPSPEKMAAIRKIDMTPDLEEMQLRLQEMPPEQQKAVEAGEAEIDFEFLL